MASLHGCKVVLEFEPRNVSTTDPCALLNLGFGLSLECVHSLLVCARQRGVERDGFPTVGEGHVAPCRERVVCHCFAKRESRCDPNEKTDMGVPKWDPRVGDPPLTDTVPVSAGCLVSGGYFGPLVWCHCMLVSRFHCSAFLLERTVRGHVCLCAGVMARMNVVETWTAVWVVTVLVQMSWCREE